MCKVFTWLGEGEGESKRDEKERKAKSERMGVLCTEPIKFYI